ncbi:MAG TPA: mechanosensitive ion channel domain-containing protein [Anaeromyxobacteraceae bacterium]|nr:mechanosensitive ion channel domain-containing protein [Anaeromyxobacteraceae bacterium]
MPLPRALVSILLQLKPESILHQAPLDLLWWQWLAMPIAALAAIAAGKVVTLLAERALQQVVSRTPTPWNHLLFSRLRLPVTAIFSLAAAYFLKLPLQLSEAGEARVDSWLRLATVVVFFWAGLRAVDVGFQMLGATQLSRSHSLGQNVLPMLRKIAKVTMVTMAVLAVLTDLGYPVGSLLAGLGIGGLAFALAAQKTVENLFGSISITVDRPFQVGDFVRIEGGLLGTVENLGLRSTRVRTPDRTVITLPNGKLADQRIETFAARDRIRFFVTLQLEYGTSAEEMRAVLKGADAVLRQHPRVFAPDGISVRFVGLSPCSLDIETTAFFNTSNWDEYQVIRENILLAFLDVVEGAGTSLAFPTQTIHLRNGFATSRGTNSSRRVGDLDMHGPSA